MYPRMEFIASYLEITCVYYILLDNHDLQSCQVGQGKDVAITTPAQLTLCSLGHQAVPWLAGGLDSMWHISTNGFWSEKNSLISVWLQIARQCFQRSTWSHWGETWCANVHVRASKMEDRKSGARTRCHFSHLTLIFRLEIDIQESSCLE